LANGPCANGALQKLKRKKIAIQQSPPELLDMGSISTLKQCV